MGFFSPNHFEIGRKIATFAMFGLNLIMKYSELEKRLRKIGCYETGSAMNGHPEWYSPVTEESLK